jgi:hypothetical protein
LIHKKCCNISIKQSAKITSSSISNAKQPSCWALCKISSTTSMTRSIKRVESGALGWSPLTSYAWRALYFHTIIPIYIMLRPAKHNCQTDFFKMQYEWKKTTSGALVFGVHGTPAVRHY